MTSQDHLIQLSHRDVTLRKRALLALSHEGDPALLKLLIGQPQLFEGELQELLVNIFVRNRSRWAAQIASELLYATRETMRQLGITILHQMGEVSLEPLNRLRHSKNPRVRLGVLQALAGIHPSVHTEWISPFLRDPDPRVVAEAVHLVAKYGDETTVLQLKDTFTQYPELRTTILWAMARYFHPQQLLFFFKSYLIHDANLLDTFLTILDGYAPRVIQPILSTLVTESLEYRTQSLTIIARHLQHHVEWKLSSAIIPQVRTHRANMDTINYWMLMAACDHPAFFQELSCNSAVTPQVTQALQLYTRRFPELMVHHFASLPEHYQETVLDALLTPPIALTLKQWLTLSTRLTSPSLLARLLTTLIPLLSADKQHFIGEILRRFTPQQLSEILQHVSTRQHREILLTAYLKAVPISEAVIQAIKQAIRGAGYLLFPYFQEAIDNGQWDVIRHLNALDTAEIFYLFSQCGQHRGFSNHQLFIESWQRLAPANRPALLLALIQALSPDNLSQFMDQLPVEISARTLIINSSFLDLLALQDTKIQYTFLTLIYFE